MATWNAAFEVSPADGDNPSAGASKIRETRVEVGDRAEKEHTWAGTVAADGTHKAGAAKVYLTTATPTLQPDGATALGTADKGRLWMSTATGKMYVYTGSAWTSIGGTGVATKYETQTKTSVGTVPNSIFKQALIVTGFTSPIKAIMNAIVGYSTLGGTTLGVHFPGSPYGSSGGVAGGGFVRGFSLGATSVKVDFGLKKSGSQSTSSLYKAQVTAILSA